MTILIKSEHSVTLHQSDQTTMYIFVVTSMEHTTIYTYIASLII